MTREEYIKKMNEEDWAPGWDAIDDEFNRIYPHIKPLHYGTDIQTRAIFGGDNFLDGFSIYDTGKGYQHIVTYGMSCLYADEESFGGEFSGWGYEMSIKLKEETAKDCIWAMNMLGNIARYTYKSKNYFEAGEYVSGNGKSIHVGIDSAITALLVINDTSAQTLNTVHGKLEFLQMVGITQSELDAIKKDSSNVQLLIDLMKKDNPEFITDMNRTYSYL